jgi:hypothetical protein
MKFQRIRRFVRKHLYHEETGFLLNYLTLTIDDPSIERELVLHRGAQFKRIVTPTTIFSLLSLLSTIYSFFVQKSGNPMMIVTGILTILCMLFLQLLVRLGKAEYCVHLAVPYLLIHAVGSVCAYKEWEPASFIAYPKDVMQF